MHREFGKAGLTIPYPQRDLHIYHHGSDGKLLELPKAALDDHRD